MRENGKRDCELCGSSDASFFTEAKGVDSAHDRTFRLAKCKSCGLIWMNSKFDAEELKSTKFNKCGKRGSFFFRIFDFLMDAFTLLRAKKIEKLKRKGSILDVGCGYGGFLKRMYSRGWDCYGVDISTYAVSTVGSEKGINVFSGRFSDVKLPQIFFDVITFWQSFEHLDEPSRSLRQVCGLLKDDGIIFISVPNVDGFEAGINLKKWFGLDLPRHTYQYSPKTLSGLLEKNGFSVIALSKNSLEYNFPFFAQTFFNVLGGEFNLLYNFLKRNKCADKTNAFLRLYTILLSVTLLPATALGTITLYFINIVCGNGPVIEVFARKKYGWHRR